MSPVTTAMPGASRPPPEPVAGSKSGNETKQRYENALFFQARKSGRSENVAGAAEGVLNDEDRPR